MDGDVHVQEGTSSAKALHDGAIANTLEEETDAVPQGAVIPEAAAEPSEKELRKLVSRKSKDKMALCDLFCIAPPCVDPCLLFQFKSLVIFHLKPII